MSVTVWSNLAYMGDWRQEGGRPGSVAGMSRVRRLATSLFLAVVVLFMAQSLGTASVAGRSTVEGASPLARAVGLDQHWGMFSPDPRPVSLHLSAIVRFDDGTTSTWRAPQGDDLLGAERDFRWGKWVEGLALRDGRYARKAAAEWIAREEARPGREVVSVTLVREITPTPAPGEPAEAIRTRPEILLLLDLRESR